MTAKDFHALRACTQALVAPLSEEDCVVQSMPDASPAKWHLAHTTWFFETFVLARALPDYRPFHPQFSHLFNSYYESVGPRHCRPRRGLLTRPSLDEVQRYRAYVDQRMDTLLARPALVAELASIIELGMHHEQQHQELILTDIKHAFFQNPLAPAYQSSLPEPVVNATDLHWITQPGGMVEIGHVGDSFAFDNESPRHAFYLQAFDIASRLVTNAEYVAFIEDGGYRRPELWLSDGWSTVQSEGWNAPLYWQDGDRQRAQFTLSGMRELLAGEPVCHLSFYEADAFARWSGARLPTEEEWEAVAVRCPVSGNFADSGRLHPAVAGASDDGQVCRQMFGDVWQWTRSAYSPYPGYRAAEGALGEYNGKFMCNQIVLRGGSCVTPQSHMRATYRNFFPASARWQFSGLRLVRDR